MIRRIPQPPVNAAAHDLEHHEVWPGLVAALIGSILVFCGARHLTGVETVQGDTAWEIQLMKAFSSGGLQFADQVAVPRPPKGGDSEALARWARQSAAPAWKVRVDAGAKAPCPT